MTIKTFSTSVVVKTAMYASSKNVAVADASAHDKKVNAFLEELKGQAAGASNIEIVHSQNSFETENGQAFRTVFSTVVTYS